MIIISPPFIMTQDFSGSFFFILLFNHIGLRNVDQEE